MAANDWAVLENVELPNNEFVSCYLSACCERALVVASQERVYSIVCSQEGDFERAEISELEQVRVAKGTEILSVEVWCEALDRLSLAVAGCASGGVEDNAKLDCFLSIFSGRCDEFSRITFERYETVALGFLPFVVRLVSAEPLAVAVSGGGGVRLYTSVDKRLMESQNIALDQSIFLLPELSSISSTITAIDIQVFDDIRYVASGAQDGSIQISMHPSSSLEPADSTVFSAFTDGIVSGVFLWQEGKTVNLLLSAAIGFAKVYENISGGISSENSVFLPESDSSDSILCCGVHVPTNLLLLGTYAQELLMYAKEPSGRRSGDEELPQHWQRSSHHYVLLRRLLLPDPVRSVLTYDFTRDGADEIVVITMRSVHILQLDLNVSQRKIIQALDAIET